MIVASPGGLQSALDEAASTGDWVRCENGASFSPNSVTVPAGVRLDAQTATFDASAAGSGPVFSFESGGFMQGGHIDISGDGFSGVVFDLDAGSSETITGTTGPQGTTIFGPYTAPDGDTGGATVLRLRAQDGGVVEGISTTFHARHVYQTIKATAQGTGIVRNNDIYAVNGQAYSWVVESGDGELTGNTWFGHNQPNRDTAPYQWLVDAPNAHDEWAEGYLWDPHRQAQRDVDGDGSGEGVTVEVARASGNIKYGNAQDRTEEQCNQYHCFYDHSSSSGNRAISSNTEAGPSAEGTRDQLGYPLNARRFEARRFYQAAGLMPGTSDGGGGGGSTNEAPTASDDSATVQNGGTATINVLANDSDPDGSLDASTVTVTTAPQNGSTTVNADGTIDYTHSGSDTSSDSFGYTVDDDSGATSNEATVSISVGSTTTLTIESVDGSGVKYELSVTGDTLEKSTAYNASINSNDNISGSTASGRVVGGRDSYEFTGDLDTFAAEGDINLLIDGSVVDNDQAVQTSTITIEPTTNGNTNYTFTVSSTDLAKSTALGATIDGNDKISDGGSVADGKVNKDRDSYTFSGSVESFAVNNGNPTVYLNGRVR